MTATEHLDHEALAELKDVMEDEFSILIETYLQDSAERVRQLQHAFALRDADAFGRMAHSFKGSCINIGAPRLGELCMEAERMGRQGSLDGAPALLEAIAAEFEIVREQLHHMLPC